MDPGASVGTAHGPAPDETGLGPRLRHAEEAWLRDTESFARSLHIVMKGSIVAASEGDTQAGQRGKSMAFLLIEQHR
jgi:hypothetical protein